MFVSYFVWCYFLQCLTFVPVRLFLLKNILRALKPLLLRCYERFMDPCTGIISGPVNMASGILDLRQEQPRIFGNWLQYYGRIDLGKGLGTISGLKRGNSL